MVLVCAMSLAVCVCVHEFRDVNKTFHVFNGCCCKMEIFTAAVVVYTYFNCQAWWGIILCKCTYSSPFIYRGAQESSTLFLRTGQLVRSIKQRVLAFCCVFPKKRDPLLFFRPTKLSTWVVSFWQQFTDSTILRIPNRIPFCPWVG